MGKTTVSGFKSNFKLKHYINYIVIALFLVVMTEQWKASRDHTPALVGLGVSLVCLLIFGSSGDCQQGHCHHDGQRQAENAGQFFHNCSPSSSCDIHIPPGSGNETK